MGIVLVKHKLYTHIEHGYIQGFVCNCESFNLNSLLNIAL